MTVEELKKCCPNTLDVVVPVTGGFHVHFYGSISDKGFPTRAVVTLFVEGDYAQVATSTCLTTNHWIMAAEAYARAAEFIHLSGLKDYAPRR